MFCVLSMRIFEYVKGGTLGNVPFCLEELPQPNDTQKGPGSAEDEPSDEIIFENDSKEADCRDRKCYDSKSDTEFRGDF